MQAKRDRFFKTAFYAAAVLLIAAAPLAHAGETAQLIFRRADLKPGPSSQPPVRPAFKSWAVVSPDGKYRADTAKDGRIRYARVSDGTVERTFYACEPMVLQFSTDGSFLAVAGNCHRWGKGEELTVKIWLLKTRAAPLEIKVPGKWADAIAGRGARVIISSEAGVYCYTHPAGTMEWSHRKPAGICDLKFSGDGQSVLASFTDGTFETYDARSGVRRE